MDVKLVHLAKILKATHVMIFMEKCPRYTY